MARVVFSTLLDEILGKLGGSVFQNSYGGYQIRTRVTPANPQSTFQQLRRGDFGFLSASWRDMSPTDRTSFADAAPSPAGALNLFLSANVNLAVIDEPPITNYTPTTAPIDMQIDLLAISPGAVIIQASGATTTVPTGTKLAVYLTYQKPATRIFNSPGDYSPVMSFDEGFDLSVAQNILTAFNDRFGQVKASGRIALKSRLIDKSNGLSGPETFSAVDYVQGNALMHFGVPAVVGGFNCSGGLRVWVWSSGTIGVGFALFWDQALTVPVTGFTNYTEEGTGIVYTVNPATGVGTGIAGFCV